MQKRSLKINGTILRNCERCGIMKICNSFEVDGKNHLMCNNCTFEEFNHGKLSIEGNIKDCDICNDCDLMTMCLNKDLTKITDTHVIKYFQCVKCGRRKKTKTKKGRDSSEGKYHV